MGQQAAQRQPDLDDVDPRVRASGDTATQDVNRQRDDHALMTCKLLHRSAKIVRFEPYDILRVLAVGVWWPIAVAGLRAPTLVAAIG
jgi:hypothetical protein